MLRAMMNRLAKLENATVGLQLHCIEVVFVSPGGARRPAFTTYRDGSGNIWRRQEGETSEDFSARARAEAQKKASKNCRAFIIPDDYNDL
jgi:hypothetical protein